MRTIQITNPSRITRFARYASLLAGRGTFGVF
jgi:hypothetical protein